VASRDGCPLELDHQVGDCQPGHPEHRGGRRYRLLTGGSRTALPRHRTLRAVVDWSWDLLSDAERLVLRRLSVFSAGASLEAAERVCAGDGALPDARHDQGADWVRSAYVHLWFP